MIRLLSTLAALGLLMKTPVFQNYAFTNNHQNVKEIAAELFSAANLLRMKVARTCVIAQYPKQITTAGNFQIGTLNSE